MNKILIVLVIIYAAVLKTKFALYIHSESNTHNQPTNSYSCAIYGFKSVKNGKWCSADN
jgi:hypothetical protein